MSWKNRLRQGPAWAAPGFSSGLAAMLFLSRWTWLEMRWNSGQLWWAVTVAFLFFGLLYGKAPRWRGVLFADGLLLLALLLTCPGSGIRVLPAALFREGLGGFSLSLEAAGLTLITGWLVTHLVFLTIKFYKVKGPNPYDALRGSGTGGIKEKGARG